jgi:hypothetical protein
MIKRVFLLLMVVLVVQAGRAQFLGGIFDQGATELKEYAQQIAALQVYIGEAEKGYRIVESGLASIGNINQGEYELHQAFFSSLAAVNPKIANMAEVAEILALQVSIVEGFTASMNRWKKGGGLSAGELEAAGQVYSTIYQAGLQDLRDLLNLTTPGKLTMPDDQRILRIQALDGDMKQQYVFVQQFSAQTDMLAAERQGAGAQAGMMKQYYGLP